MLRTNKLIFGSLLATALLVLASDLALAGKPAPPTPPPSLRFGIASSMLHCRKTPNPTLFLFSPEA